MRLLFIGDVVGRSGRMAVTAMTEVSRGLAFQHTDMVSDTATGTGWSKAVADLKPDSTVFMRALFPQKWERSGRADRTMLAPERNGFHGTTPRHMLTPE